MQLITMLTIIVDPACAPAPSTTPPANAMTATPADASDTDPATTESQPVTPPSTGNEGNEGNEGDEGNEGNEGNEGAQRMYLQRMYLQLYVCMRHTHARCCARYCSATETICADCASSLLVQTAGSGHSSEKPVSSFGRVATAALTRVCACAGDEGNEGNEGVLSLASSCAHVFLMARLCRIGPTMVLNASI